MLCLPPKLDELGLRRSPSNQADNPSLLIAEPVIDAGVFKMRPPFERDIFGKRLDVIELALPLRRRILGVSVGLFPARNVCGTSCHLGALSHAWLRRLCGEGMLGAIQATPEARQRRRSGRSSPLAQPGVCRPGEAERLREQRGWSHAALTMSTSLIASLRKQLPSIYGEHLPDDIRYCGADGHVVVALDAATVDELAFAIQTANAEALALGRRRTALEELHTEVRKRAARGADRIVDVAWED